MRTNFDYLIEKVTFAEFDEEPFRHIYIEDFFSPEHLAAITSSDEIGAPEADDDRSLIDSLEAKGFRPIEFPGCVTDVDRYLDWRAGGKSKHHTACEGFGMALRLYDIRSPILKSINDFIGSEEFNRAIAHKFGVDYDACVVDGGIQKYLDGYEISPHPDIRKKAATFMVNINPSPRSQGMDHHTHYLKLKPERQYVQSFWEGNETVDRCWVPWAWADTVKQQCANNSIVLFSPANDTLHGVKANYDHLVTQRTQLYGNLWYKQTPAKSGLEWEDLDLVSIAYKDRRSLRRRAAAALPQSVKATLKHALSRSGRRSV